MNRIDKTLAERGTRYGSFETQSRIAQAIKVIMQASPNWFRLGDDQREAFDMIANKMGRVLNGDPYYADSWVDIAGYAKLVADRLSALNSNSATIDPKSMTEAVKLAGDASEYVDRFSEQPQSQSAQEARDWLTMAVQESERQAASPASQDPEGCS